MADPIPSDLTREEQVQRVLGAITRSAGNYRTAASNYYCMLEGTEARRETQPDYRPSTEEEKGLVRAWMRWTDAGLAMTEDAIKQGRKLGVPEDISLSAAYAIMVEMEDQFKSRKLECPVASLEIEPARPSRPRSLAGVADPGADT